MLLPQSFTNTGSRDSHHTLNLIFFLKSLSSLLSYHACMTSMGCIIDDLPQAVTSLLNLTFIEALVSQ
jgi:hypothetical protein